MYYYIPHSNLQPPINLAINYFLNFYLSKKKFEREDLLNMEFNRMFYLVI